VIITVVGRCIGSGDRAQAKAYSRLLLLLAYFSVGGVAIFTAVFSQPLVNFFSLSPESTKLAIELTLFHSAISLAIWPSGFVLPSSFRAAGDVRFPLIVSMSCMWLLRVAGAYVSALSEISVFGWFTIPGLGLGIWGVWLAMLCDWIVRATSYLIRYFSGAWLKKKSMVE
jgi:Na+-driven multidrug efflux pump